MRLQCLKEETYPLAFRGQLLWSGTGRNEVPEIMRRPPATEGGINLADGEGLIEATEFVLAGRITSMTWMTRAPVRDAAPGI